MLAVLPGAAAEAVLSTALSVKVQEVKAAVAPKCSPTAAPKACTSAATMGSASAAVRRLAVKVLSMKATSRAVRPTLVLEQTAPQTWLPFLSTFAWPCPLFPSKTQEAKVTGCACVRSLSRNTPVEATPGEAVTRLFRNIQRLKTVGPMGFWIQNKPCAGLLAATLKSLSSTKHLSKRVYAMCCSRMMAPPTAPHPVVSKATWLRLKLQCSNTAVPPCRKLMSAPIMKAPPDKPSRCRLLSEKLMFLAVSPGWKSLELPF